MIHRLVDLPAVWSRSTRLANLSSFPTSPSNCRSHTWESNSENHQRNTPGSLDESVLIGLSICSTLLIS